MEYLTKWEIKQLINVVEDYIENIESWSEDEYEYVQTLNDIVYKLELMKLEAND